MKSGIENLVIQFLTTFSGVSGIHLYADIYHAIFFNSNFAKRQYADNYDIYNAGNLLEGYCCSWNRR